jgi:hypothetical protein
MRGGCHPDLASQARMGATPAHEAEPFGSIAARRALVPWWGVSPADAKGPCRWKALQVVPTIRGHARVGKRPRQLSPGRAHAKAWTPPTENRSGRSDRSVRGRPHRPLGEEHAPARSRKAPNGADAARRSEGSGHVMTPLPRPRGRSQNPPLPPGAQAPGTHREPTSTGARSREVWEADIGRTHRSFRLCGVALQDAASQRRLARRKPSPR